MPLSSPSSPVAVYRQPVVDADRNVRAYALRAATSAVATDPVAEDLVEAHYAQLDLTELAGDAPVILRATARILSGAVPLPTSAHGTRLELTPRMAADADAATHVVALRTRDVGTVLGDYTATPGQDALVPLAGWVKVDATTEPERLRTLAERAHALGGQVIAERVGTARDLQAAQEAGADLLQGPMLVRREEAQTREGSAGELQCLELVRLLSVEDEINFTAVANMVASDPEMSVRVLHMVNSSAFALARTVDSVRTAVVLMGARRLAALAMASLIDARPTAVGPLWAVLTRALACRTLTDETGYTVGLLSAVSAQQNLSLATMVRRTGVSAQVADALLNGTGRYGSVLEAVVAYEADDPQAVIATGIDPFAVAHAYLDAVPAALSTATALCVEPVSA